MSPLRRSVALVLLAVVASGCFTGERPSFSTDTNVPGALTGDAVVDAVLTRLDAAAVATDPFTAHYDVLTKFGNEAHTAIVVGQGVSRVVSVDESVRFVQTPAFVRTCIGGQCEEGLRQQAISNTQLTVDFYGADTAKRMRIDAGTKIGPAISREETVAGLSADCVDLPQSNAQRSYTSVFCALESGVLARLDDADLAITLTSFSPTSDPTAFG